MSGLSLQTKARVLLTFLLGFGCLFYAHSGKAATWDGGGGNNNWSTALNWDDDATPAPTEETPLPLVFPVGASRLSNTNDLMDFQCSGLTLSGSGYTLGNDGNSSLTLSGNILASHSSGANVINMTIQLLDDGLLTVQNAGALLTIDGEFDVDGNLTIDGDGDLNLGAGDESLEGAGNVIKKGAGTLALAGNSEGFGGTLTIDEGVLVIEGIVGQTPGEVGSITLDDGTRLQGDGETVFSITVNPGAEVRPGSSPGTLAVGNIVFEESSVLSIEINGPVLGTEYSQLAVTGTVTLNNPLLRIALGAGVGIGDDFTIVLNDGSEAIVGEFNDLAEGATFTLVGIDDLGFNITYQGGDGNDVVLQSLPTLSINDVTVQEPSSGTATASFTVTLSEASQETVTVDFQTQDGTAIAPQDYLPANGTLSFSPGQTVQRIDVTVNSGSGGEGDESFLVNLINSTNAAVAVDLGTGTITSSGGGGGGGCALGSGSGSMGTALCFAGLFLSVWLMRRKSQA